MTELVLIWFLMSSFGVAAVMAWVWSIGLAGCEPTEAEARKAARWTLTIPLWMWVALPGLLAIALYVLADKIHDLWLMAKAPPKRMPEPTSEKGPYR